MNDRELLELAAKAAGIKLIPYESAPLIDEEGETYWNPLTDDGDAFRLAVTLGLPIKRGKWNSGVRYVSCHRTWHCNDSLWYDEGVSLDDGDEYAATRRAIVRAAAEKAR